VGTFAAFPATTEAAAAARTPSRDEAAAGPAADAADTNAALPAKTNWASPPSGTGGPSSNDAVGVETTG
jgi:hypothetical protein